MSTIAILGTGLMGKALGIGWSRAGHAIRVGSRTPEDVTATELGFEPQTIAKYADAINLSDVVVVAIPFTAVAPLITENRDALRDKVVIDISNPFDALATNSRAAAEVTADALGTTSGLVAAFKDNFAATINAPGAADGQPPQVKIAADDDDAKAVVAGLVADLGLSVLDCGPLHNARYLDGMVSLMLILDRTFNDFSMTTGWRFTGVPQS
jgi:predicted dinucleotide-binding enzyme